MEAKVSSRRRRKYRATIGWINRSATSAPRRRAAKSQTLSSRPSRFARTKGSQAARRRALGLKSPEAKNWTGCTATSFTRPSRNTKRCDPASLAKNELLFETRAANELVHDRLVVEISQRPGLEQPSVFSDRRSLATENGFFLEEERFDVELPLYCFFSRRPRRCRAGNAAPDDDEARSRPYG